MLAVVVGGLGFLWLCFEYPKQMWAIWSFVLKLSFSLAAFGAAYFAVVELKSYVFVEHEVDHGPWSAKAPEAKKAIPPWEEAAQERARAASASVVTPWTATIQKPHEQENRPAGFYPAKPAHTAFEFVELFDDPTKVPRK